MRKTIVITGASDGVGAAAARELSRRGHHLIVVGRNRLKTDAVARDTGATPFTADFACLSDVRRLASDLDAHCARIDVLANNAGGIFSDYSQTTDGLEQSFQINHLAPFLLTRLLIGKLTESNATVIQTSSVAARMLGRLELDTHRPAPAPPAYSAMRTYGTTKLANILFTRELHRRYHAAGLSAVAFHPGAVASNFAADTGGIVRYLARSWPARAFMVSPKQAAAQMVWLAEGVAGADWVPGSYYEKRKPARRENPQACDSDLAQALWDYSESLLRERMLLN